VQWPVWGVILDQNGLWLRAMRGKLPTMKLGKPLPTFTQKLT